MGFANIFRRDLVTNAKILICAVGHKFDDAVRCDAEVYGRYYSTTVDIYSEPDDLMDALSQGYDVVHLLCNVTSDGHIEGSQLSGTALMEACCNSGVKLLWIASDNDIEGYISGFKANGKRINLVMTLQRNGAYFSEFLGNLLSRMVEGNAMPIAWSAACPQGSGSSHSNAPESIFFAGRGGVRLQ